MKDPQHHPPAWADRLLNSLCRPDYADEILGDLHEAFYWRLQKGDTGRAKIRFIWEVFKSLRPKNLKSFYHFSVNTMIFRNYIKIAFRTLLKRKSTSFINIFGLSIGAAAFLLIFLYAYQILTHDGLHANKDRIFLAYKERITPNGVQATYDTWVPMKERLVKDYSQVEKGARIFESDVRIVKNNQFLEERMTYTDESFFDIFSFPILHGNENKIFTNKSSVVLNLELARKYFGTDNPIGETLEIFLPNEDTTLLFQVSAVLDEHPRNTSINPTLIIQIEGLPTYPEFANSWRSSFLETYVLLDNKESNKELEAVFPDLIETLWGVEVRERTNFKLLPFGEYYDTFIGRKADARILLLIGFGILLIATINFMNLSTAQASQRTREIGLRKVLGAFKGQLRTQFLTEAFIASLFATMLGLVIVTLSISAFNDFFNVTISFSTFSAFEIVSASVGLAIALGIMSGSYPAIYLSSIRAMDAIRQKMGFGGSVSFRNGLVVLQFSIALFLIASSFFIRNQIIYMSQREMGFDDEGIVVINASRSDFIDREQGLERLNTLKNQLKDLSYISNVATSRSIPTSWVRSFTFVRPDGWTGDPSRMSYTYVDASFFDTYNISIVSGANFLPDTEGDQRSSVIINQAAMSAFEFDYNEQNVIQIGERKLNVVGVVEDFNYESLQNEIEPTLIFHRRASNPVHTFITCKMDLTNIQSKLEEMEGLWNNLGSTNDFTYSFMDERVNNLYQAERRYLGLVTLFSTLAIVVACLGLYGLTLFIIEKRRKEISIRKVLGAEISGILKLIFKDFTKWVAIAFIVSVPFVVYFIDQWLTEFHYRIDISWITFAITLVIVMALVLLTVGYQSIRAASSNPVRYLKDE